MSSVQNLAWLVSIGDSITIVFITVWGILYEPITIKRLQMSVEHQEHDDEPVDGMRFRGFPFFDQPMV